MEVFFTFFNIIQALYALAFTAGSVYVFYTDGTLISKVALGLSAFYLATAFMGLAGRMYKCGNGLYIILLIVLLLVQAAFFVAFTFYSDDVLGWLREVDDKAVTETVDKAWDTINSHKSVVKISLGVDVGFIAAALALSVFTATRRSSPMYLETSPV